MSEAVETWDQSPAMLVLAEVIAERANQEAKWGEQNHPSLFSENARRKFAAAADRWKAINDARSADDDSAVTWDGVLLEEVYEALAEEGEDLMRTELVQVAAVAVAWIESIDRRTRLLEDEETEESEGVDVDG